MSEYVFMFKENGTNDRDCVKYIESERLGKLECGHYFPSINLNGSCFSTSFKIDEIDFNNITSILTKEDFLKLDNYNKQINNLGYGITSGDERYLKGIELYNEVKEIFNKLLSKENEDLFLQVQEEEAENLGYVTKENNRYFDYEKFGEDLLESENYLELSNGRIISYLY
jgi:hypothetical protein